MNTLNTFGLCFSFLLPGILIGFLGGWVAGEAWCKEKLREIIRRKK